MILLDAYALIALLLDEPPAAEVDSMVRTGDCAVVSVNLAEVLDHLLRRRSVPPDAIAESVGPLLDEVIEVRPVGTDAAWRASTIRATHYRRKVAELSLADCLLLASARIDDEIATSDPVIATVARAEKIALRALPDSDGSAP